MGQHSSIEEQDRSGDSSRISTGFAQLDEILGGGLKGRRLYVIGARPAMGKTSLAISMALAACEMGRKVLYYNIDTDPEKFMARVSVLKEDYSPNGKTINGIPNLYVVNTHDIPVEMIGESVNGREPEDADMIIADYMQLIGISPENMTEAYDFNHESYEYICSKLKELATERNIPVILPVMLPRDLEKRIRTKKRPVLSDFRDFGAAADIADTVLFIYREGYYNINSDNVNTGEICVAKNDGGDTGTCILGYDRDRGRFTS